jgi:hypothetical protein
MGNLPSDGHDTRCETRRGSSRLDAVVTMDPINLPNAKRRIRS